VNIVEGITHGTRNGYNHWLCRCHRCREANRLYKIELRGRAPRQPRRYDPTWGIPVGAGDETARRSDLAPSLGMIPAGYMYRCDCGQLLRDRTDRRNHVCP